MSVSLENRSDFLTKCSGLLFSSIPISHLLIHWVQCAAFTAVFISLQLLSFVSKKMVAVPFVRVERTS